MSEPLSNYERYVPSEGDIATTLRTLVSIPAKVFDSRPELLETTEGKEVLHKIARMTFSLPYINGRGPTDEAMSLLEKHASATIDAMARDGLIHPENGSGSSRAFEYLSNRLSEDEFAPLLSRALTSYGHYRAGYQQMLSRLNDIDPEDARSTARAMQFRSSSIFSIAGWKDTVTALFDSDYAKHLVGRKEAADDLFQSRLPKGL